MKVQKTLTWLFKAGVAGILALATLSLFSACYFYNGVHIESTTGATDCVWEPNQRLVNMQEGFNVTKMDEFGFNNIIDSQGRKVDILLMGGSHMQAAEVDQDLNVSYLLNMLHPEMYTYNMVEDMIPGFVYLLSDGANFVTG